MFSSHMERTIGCNKEVTVLTRVSEKGFLDSSHITVSSLSKMITEFLVLFKMEVIKKVNVIIVSFLFQCLEFLMRKMMEI